MKPLKMKWLLVVMVCSPWISAVNGQSIVGTWQLLKESRCMDETAKAGDDSLRELRDEMHRQSPATPRVVSFRQNASGEESTRILNRKRTANSRKFYYKFSGDMLLILDKKSQTITDSYRVEKFTADSLIVSSASRPCETRIFQRIKGDRTD